METGLGVSGAGSEEAGWATLTVRCVDLRGAAGFFLAAFFLADFRVGFFLAVACVAPRFALLCADGLRSRAAALVRAGFFFFTRAPEAVALRAFFFALAICAFSSGARFQCSAACAWLATSR
jgi:hypothetical protein